MIKHLFFDLDQSIISTTFSPPEQTHLEFVLQYDGNPYYTIVRPCAKSLIEFSRNLIGEENVFILTAALKEYACQINKLAELGFKEENILAREDLEVHAFPTAYGGKSIVASKYAHVDNVLIDDLEPKYNDKVLFLGMWRSCEANYFKVQPYYGVNFPNDKFEEEVKSFLAARHEAPSLCKDLSGQDLEISP